MIFFHLSSSSFWHCFASARFLWRDAGMLECWGKWEICERCDGDGFMIHQSSAMGSRLKISPTFDGEIPHFGNEETWPRLLVGNTVRVTHNNGTETVGTLKHACAVPEGNTAFSCIELADGKNVLEEVPLTEAEIAGYRDHSDAFFGRYDPHAGGPINDPRTGIFSGAGA